MKILPVIEPRHPIGIDVGMILDAVENLISHRELADPILVNNRIFRLDFRVLESGTVVRSSGGKTSTRRPTPEMHLPGLGVVGGRAKGAARDGGPSHDQANPEPNATAHPCEEEGR